MPRLPVAVPSQSYLPFSLLDVPYQTGRVQGPGPRRVLGECLWRGWLCATTSVLTSGVEAVRCLCSRFHTFTDKARAKEQVETLGASQKVPS